MIVVTGGAGFIGSNLVADLEAGDRGSVAVVDWLGTGEKWRNLVKRRLAAVVDPEGILEFLDVNASRITAVFHLGAVSSTTERDVDRLATFNIRYTVALWDWCAAHGVAFIYASSAATYGARESNFSDDDDPRALAALRPLNAYGWSKKVIDDIFAARAAACEPSPPHWAGIKFFNVYGPNEYHKDGMRSVALKLHDTVSAGHPVRLFRSNRPGIADGDQRRDFVYVKDCTRALIWLLDHPEVSGIFNLGSGKARSFLDVARALESAMGRALEIEFIDMPEALRDRYQYFTEADMTRLAARGFPTGFASLEDGIGDYVSSYLARVDRYR